MKHTIRAAFATLAPALVVSLALALCACSDDGGRTAPSEQKGVADVLAEQVELADQAQAADQAVVERVGTQTTAEEDIPTTMSTFVGDAKPAFDAVDVDLTAMNADMVYATVFDMMNDPEAYVGKTVRMSGPYRHTYFEETQGDYYYVIISDALACCTQGLEFIWGDDSHVWPADYPDDGTEVVVCGRFESYLERGMTYIHLVDASLQAA